MMTCKCRQCEGRLDPPDYPDGCTDECHCDECLKSVDDYKGVDPCITNRERLLDMTVSDGCNTRECENCRESDGREYEPDGREVEG
jgi:hypothetical protein